MKSTGLHSESTTSEIEEIKAFFAESEKRYQTEIKLLKEQIQVLQDKLFGRKSEKRPVDDKQLLLFEEIEDNAVECIENEEVEIPSYNRKKRGRKPLPPELPRHEVIHDIAEEDKLCECGCTKSRCGEEVSEQLDIIPPVIRVIKNIRLKYACKACEGVESEKPPVMIAPVPPQFIPKSNATSGLIANIIINKFSDALPFYRQEKIFARLGIDIPRSTMCGWAIKAAEKCRPLIDLLHKEILSGPLINLDETTVQVHNEPGRKNTSTSYMWVFRGGPPNTPVYMFRYHPTRAGAVAKSFLDGYKGFVQTDGYAGYDFLDAIKGVYHVGCWAHARRKFVEASKVVKNSTFDKTHSSADEAIEFIGKLYGVERQIRERNLNPEEIQRIRQESSRPIFDEFKTWLKKKSLIIVPKGTLGKAISYTLSQWDRLIKYIDLDCITPDNNLAENAIRPFVVGRKNWLFSDTPEGADASAIFFSLIETAKANNLEPYQYLKYVFGKLPLAESTEDYKALLPQYIDRKELKEFTGGVVY